MRLTLNQLDMAIAALRVVRRFAHPADSVLRHFFRDNSKLGVNDRAFITETVFGILRHFFSLEYIVGTTTPRPLLLAYLVKFRGTNLRELIPFVSEAEAKWLVKIKAEKLKSQSLAVRSEFPEWLVEKMRGFMLDADILTFGFSLQQPASLDLRVNTLIAKRDEVLATLSKDGIEAQITPYSPIGIRVARNSTISQHDLFFAGKIEVQD